MKIKQIAIDKNGDLLALTENGQIFVRIEDKWQQIPGPSTGDRTPGVSVIL